MAIDWSIIPLPTLCVVIRLKSSADTAPMSELNQSEQVTRGHMEKKEAPPGSQTTGLLIAQKIILSEAKAIT